MRAGLPWAPTVLLMAIAGAAWAVSDAASPEVLLAAVGDIRPGGPIGRVIAEFGSAEPLRLVLRELQSDLLFGNLECAITERGTPADKKWTFRAPASELAVLSEAGFDWLSLANNHVMDYGPDGLADTIAALEKTGIAFAGAGPNAAAARRPVFVEKNGLRVGLLAFTSTFPEEHWARSASPGVAYGDLKRLPSWIAEAKKNCDVLVVSFHGGTELSPEPNGVQKSFARLAADSGADLVLGHHPHVIQAVERRGNSLILYSLGNFLFVSPTPGTERSVIARLRLRKGDIGAEFIPVDIAGGRLRPAAPEAARAIRAALDSMGALSADPERLRFAAPPESK